MTKTSRIKKGMLIVVSGPSGVGKGTLCKAILADERAKEKNVNLSVSATTRKMREGEAEGVNYYYISEEEFQRRIDNDEFIEWAPFCGNRYGTPAREVSMMLDEGKNVVLEIEVKGAAKVKRLFPDSVSVFVLPPSFRELRNRLIGRGTESNEVIESRLNRALEEIELAPSYDYVIVNDILDVAKEEFFAIVEAELHKSDRCSHIIEEVLSE